MLLSLPNLTPKNLRTEEHEERSDELLLEWSSSLQQHPTTSSLRSSSSRNAPLVIPQVQISLPTIVKRENLAVLERRHRTSIDVKVGIDFDGGDGKAGGEEEAADRGNLFEDGDVRTVDQVVMVMDTRRHLGRTWHSP